MREVITQSEFPNSALPSAYVVGTRTQEWIVKEAEYRRQLDATRAIELATPGPLLRTRRRTGILLIRAGIWFCAVRFPPARHPQPTV